jgi:hypothetical protein
VVRIWSRVLFVFCTQAHEKSDGAHKQPPRPTTEAAELPMPLPRRLLDDSDHSVVISEPSPTSALPLQRHALVHDENLPSDRIELPASSDDPELSWLQYLPRAVVPETVSLVVGSLETRFQEMVKLLASRVPDEKLRLGSLNRLQKQ